MTVGDWVHGIGSLLEILGIAGSALVLAGTLPRRWAAYSAATGAAVFVLLLVWQAIPYPWVGTAERVFAVLLVSWVAAMGTRLTDGPPDPDASRPQGGVPASAPAGREH